MKNHDHNSKFSGCVYSRQSPFCKTLENAGVPADEKWWSLIQHHHYLNNKQKAELQSEVVELLREKDFSDEKYREVVERQEEILSSPYKMKLKQAIEESAALFREFETVIKTRRGDVEDLEQVTVDTIQSGADPDEAVKKLRGAFKSLSEIMEQDAKNLETMAMTDPLTGLFNRRGFDEYMKKKSGEFMNGGGKLSLLMLDIDHFKKVNDTFGHRIGDQALIMVATRMDEAMRERFIKNYHAARYGGEEFAVVLPGADLPLALEAAEIIRRDIENYNFVVRNAKGKVVNKDITITISIGVAEALAEWGEGLSDRLIECADSALYRAKSEGRNRVCEYAPE
jgi:diguanylate cyclase (GGDEF)-like protein